MSYSRWITSDFYTYWCSSGAKTAEEEILACHWTLEKLFEWKYTKVVYFLENPDKLETEIDWGAFKPTKANFEELKSYFVEFKQDVDERYSLQ